MKQELERVEIPGEDAARKTTWVVARNAFAARQPVARPSHWPRVAAVAVAVCALLAGALSSPGRAVLDEIREVVGVEGAQKALFSVPAPGRLLIASDSGVWVVQQDGSRRLLGGYREATWSPFGRFVAAASENDLVALEPDGDVRWTLARPKVRFARWSGSELDTRIVYLSRAQPRVVAGDGTGDEPVCAVSAHQRVAPAWRPGPGFALAVTAPSGAVQVMDLDGCRRLWISSPQLRPRSLEWSRDGARLLVTTLEDLRVLQAGSGRVLRTYFNAVAGAFRPGSRELALIRRRGESSELVVGGRVLFRGTGEFSDVAWSPDGEWVLVTWPTADQWVFVRATGLRRIVAASDIGRQFGGGSTPRIEGWCCAR